LIGSSCHSAGVYPVNRKTQKQKRQVDLLFTLEKTMGCVYFVRHGQTIWNIENKICSATDIALTELGHQQAIDTGKRILEEGIQADEILFL
jgi:hypothetical protein